MARAKGVTPREMRDRYLEAGIRLRFDGPPGWKGQAACSQYDPALGCSIHTGRPLACRLYPLGRERQGEQVRHLYQGKQFPCLEGCAAVTQLPRLTVGEYLEGQAVAEGERAQDTWLEVVQDLAEGAFVLLLETGLAASGDRETIPRWRALGRMEPAERAASIPSEWLDRLTLASEGLPLEDPVAFARAHRDALQAAAQAAFGALRTAEAMREGSCLMAALALHLAQSLGSDPGGLALHWIGTAKRNGARE